MSLLKYVSFAFLLTGLLNGCVGQGKTTVETMMVPAGGHQTDRGRGTTTVILPFADYSNGDNITSAFRRNLLITESLTDNLSSNGFGIAVQEDVFHYLVEQKIINASSYNQKHSSSLSIDYALEDPDWSDVIKDKLKGYMEVEKMRQADKKNLVTESPGTHSLTPQEVVKIGRKFGADYVVRGRILEFRTRQEHSWDPRKRGILPVVAGATGRMAFGFADSSRYDNWDSILGGGTWGAIIGSNATGPWNPDDSHGFLGLSGGEGANTIAWSIAGGALGNMATHGGRLDQAAVQMRIWVQNAYDASVIWTNRVDVRVAPKSVLADNQYDDLFDQAVKKATTALMDNFVTYGIPQ